jgi:hypothetical protein
VCLSLYLCVCLCVCSHLSLSVCVCLFVFVGLFLFYFWASQLCMSVLCALLSFVRTMCLFCSFYVLSILICTVFDNWFCLSLSLCVCLSLYLCVSLCVFPSFSLCSRVCLFVFVGLFLFFFWASQLYVSVAMCFSFFCKNYIFVLFFIRPLHLNTSNRLDKKIQYPPQVLLIFVCCYSCYY